MLKTDFPLGARCIKCNKPADELHEIFGGAMRQLSIDSNLQAPVCRKHHSDFHNWSDNGAAFVCARYGVDYDMLNLYVNDTEQIARDLYFKFMAAVFRYNLEKYAL
jgi:hypothetical protein